MKPTKGRIRALEHMAKDGAYVRPDGAVKGSGGYRITADMEELFLRHGLMEEADGVDGYLRVWRITDKGRQFIAEVK